MIDKNRYFEYILQQFNILYVFKHTNCFLPYRFPIKKEQTGRKKQEPEERNRPAPVGYRPVPYKDVDINLAD